MGKPAIAALCLACLTGAACGGGGAAPVASADPKNSASDAGRADAGPKERVFAGSTAEATELISDAVDKNRSGIGACVREFRARKKMAHERVAVSFGIDQEGRLLGVTSKGKEDTELKSCIQEALKSAPFPRSHAGVITVTKTYEDIVQ